MFSYIGHILRLIILMGILILIGVVGIPIIIGTIAGVLVFVVYGMIQVALYSPDNKD